MTVDFQTCYRALRAHDARFDGRFFVGVKTTGIYCRPICPAKTAKAENPAEVLAADLRGLPCPGPRRDAVRSLAAAVRRDPTLFEAPNGFEGGIAEAVAKIRALPGFGDWTAQYVALRALGHADAFPVEDAALQRAARKLKGSPRSLRERAEPWRPWRGYAAQHRWSAAGSFEGISE